MKQVEFEFSLKSGSAERRADRECHFLSLGEESLNVIDGESLFKRKRQERMKEINARVAGLSSKLWRTKK
jgi:hypothetical protein